MGKFREFFLSMDNERREKYAERAEMSKQYLLTVLAGQDPAKKPRVETLHKLASASRKKLSFSDLFQDFYPNEYKAVKKDR